MLLRSGGRKLDKPSPGSRATLLICLGAIAALMLFFAYASEAEKKPRPQTKPPLEFLGEWGTKGDGPEQLSAPLTLATDEVGSVYIPDPGSAFVHKFTSRGEPLLSFQDPLLTKPVPIALDSGGGIYVADSDTSRLFIFLPEGDRLREQRRGGKARFKSIASLAVDAVGNVFVVEFDAAQILKFDSNGRFRKAWGGKGSGPGQIRTPGGIAAGLDGFVYLADQGNARVQKFTGEGAFVTAWSDGPPGTAGIKSPAGIAVNNRFVVATDENPPRVFIWTLDGVPRYVEDITPRLAPRKPEGHRRTIAGIAFLNGNELLVLDPNGPKVLRFRINL